MNTYNFTIRFPSCLLALVAVFSITGCFHVTNPKPENVHKPDLTLQQRTNCCNDFSQLAYKSLPENYRATLVVDEEDQVMQMETGKTYVEALILPQSKGTTYLEIQSIVSHHNWQKPSTMLFPIVTLLNSEYEEVATFDDLPFEYNHTLGTWRHIHMVLTLDQQFKDARYALIYTNNEKLTQGLSTQKPAQIVKLTNFESMIYVQPTQTRKRVRFTPNGVVNVLAYTEG